MAETVAELLVARSGDPHPGLVAGDETWTWAEVVQEAATRVAILEELDVAGRHVGVLLENVPEFVFLLGGAALSGSTVVGINPTRRGEELARDVRHTDCAVVFTDAGHAGLLAGLDLDDVPVVLVDDDAWAARIERHRGAPVPGAARAPDDLFMLLFTSGSTGAPKAVRMSQGRAVRAIAGSASAFTSDDVLYCAMPLFHGNALLANLLPALSAGASVVLRPRFSASAFLPDVRRHRCTYFNYVGRALSYILAVPETPEDADNELKFCVGSEASPRDRREFRRRFGCYVAEGYSSSEGAVVIQPFAGMPAGALGRAAEGSDVAVVDPETGEECPPARFDDQHVLRNPTEAIGELVGRNSLSSFEGYYANDEATAARSRNGWYWTGDLAYRDEDGVVYFAGRSADWLRVDGENFAAGPVEQLLGRFPGVASVVVYAVPDPTTGDQVMAALELDAGAAFDATAFDEFLAAQPDLGTKWRPRFVRVVGAIPLTATGKVDRNPLRGERWRTDDPVWWSPKAGEPYRRFGPDDAAALEAAFDAAGRAGVLAS